MFLDNLKRIHAYDIRLDDSQNGLNLQYRFYWAINPYARTCRFTLVQESITRYLSEDRAPKSSLKIDSYVDLPSLMSAIRSKGRDILYQSYLTPKEINKDYYIFLQK